MVAAAAGKVEHSFAAAVEAAVGLRKVQSQLASVCSPAQQLLVACKYLS